MSKELLVSDKILKFADLFLKEQIATLNYFYQDIMKDVIKSGFDYRNIRFGGGTALSLYYFQHRLSFDIDLFVTDRGYLNYFSPRLWIDESKYFNPLEFYEFNHHIGVMTKSNIMLDVLSTNNSKNFYVDKSRKFFDFNVCVETPEEIISKKIKYRIKDNIARDLFDIYIATQRDSQFLNKLLYRGLIESENIAVFYENLVTQNKDVLEKELNKISIDASFSATDLVYNLKSVLESNFRDVICRDKDITTLKEQNKIGKDSTLLHRSFKKQIK